MSEGRSKKTPDTRNGSLPVVPDPIPDDVETLGRQYLDRSGYTAGRYESRSAQQVPRGSDLRRTSVAVIIPFYNGSEWIERAIRSVVSQTIPADEFIIVNDGSSPGEREALGLLAEKYPFRIIDKPNGGQGSARNAGVAVSKSTYISFLDQDDFYLPNHLADLMKALPEDDPRLGFVYADLCEADGLGNIVLSNMLRQQSGRHPKRGHIAALLRHDMFVLPSASLIYRPAFDAVGGFDEQFIGYEDDDLFTRIIRTGFTNYFLDRPVTVWCMHAGSATNSITMSRSRFKYFKKLTASFQDNKAQDIFYFRDSLATRFGPFFITDAVKAAQSNSENRQEICDILREYRKMVCEHDSVPARHKIALRLATFLLTGFSTPKVRAMGRFIPILKRVARRLL